MFIKFKLKDIRKSVRMAAKSLSDPTDTQDRDKKIQDIVEAGFTHDVDLPSSRDLGKEHDSRVLRMILT